MVDGGEKWLHFTSHLAAWKSSDWTVKLRKAMRACTDTCDGKQSEARNDWTMEKRMAGNIGNSLNIPFGLVECSMYDYTTTQWQNDDSKGHSSVRSMIAGGSFGS